MEENKTPPTPYLHSNSKVDDAQPVEVVGSCNLDIYTFPCDIQTLPSVNGSYWISPWIKKTENDTGSDGLCVNELEFYVS